MAQDSGNSMNSGFFGALSSTVKSSCAWRALPVENELVNLIASRGTRMVISDKPALIGGLQERMLVPML
jgi:hypothetical protein